MLRSVSIETYINRCPGEHIFNAFRFTLDWLWQDYILYDYYKIKFLKRLEDFGQENMEAEKFNLRNAFKRSMSQCLQPGTAEKSKSIAHFCAYYDTPEFQMIDEVRDLQRKESLKIHLKSNEGEGKRR